MTDAPVQPRLSATALLLRDGPAGLEVFMVVRHHQIDFASGALVFPGGKVDPQDHDPRLLQRVAGAESLRPEERACRICTIRETFEEAGVLLARPRGESRLIEAARLSDLIPRYRAALTEGEIALADLLEREDLELAADLLVPFAHWITPVGMPKRFDTHFFLTPAPRDQIAVHDGSESVDSRWVAPAAALAEADAERLTLVFDTRMNLVKLARSADSAAALEASRTAPIVTVMPERIDRADGPALRIPLAAGYGVEEVAVAGMPRP